MNPLLVSVFISVATASSVTPLTTQPKLTVEPVAVQIIAPQKSSLDLILRDINDLILKDKLIDEPAEVKPVDVSNFNPQAPAKVNLQGN